MVFGKVLVRSFLGDVTIPLFRRDTVRIVIHVRIVNTKNAKKEVSVML